MRLNSGMHNSYFHCCFKTQKPKSTCLFQFDLKEHGEKGENQRFKAISFPLAMYNASHKKFYIKMSHFYFWAKFPSFPPFPGAIQLRIIVTQFGCCYYLILSFFMLVIWTIIVTFCDTFGDVSCIGQECTLLYSQYFVL